MKRFLLFALFFLSLSLPVLAQTSGGCRATGLRCLIEQCLALLQSLAPGGDMVSIPKLLWARLRQESVAYHDLQAECDTLLVEVQAARDRFRAL